MQANGANSDRLISTKEAMEILGVTSDSSFDAIKKDPDFEVDPVVYGFKKQRWPESRIRAYIARKTQKKSPPQDSPKPPYPPITLAALAAWSAKLVEKNAADADVAKREAARKEAQDEIAACERERSEMAVWEDKLAEAMAAHRTGEFPTKDMEECRAFVETKRSEFAEIENAASQAVAALPHLEKFERESRDWRAACSARLSSLSREAHLCVLRDVTKLAIEAAAAYQRLKVESSALAVLIMNKWPGGNPPLMPQYGLVEPLRICVGEIFPDLPGPYRELALPNVEIEAIEEKARARLAELGLTQ